MSLQFFQVPNFSAYGKYSFTIKIRGYKFDITPPITFSLIGLKVLIVQFKTKNYCSRLLELNGSWNGVKEHPFT